MVYNSLFKHAENHIKIVRELAKRPRGMDQDELLKAVKLTSGGTSSKILKELAEAGFILAIPNFSKGKKNRKYKLIDFYSLFYLAWIEKANQQSIGEIESNYWQKLEFTPAWKSWSGYAFENVCLQHIPQIKSALGIAGVNSKNSAWWNTDSQIDLVIDRADQCINLCEIRFHNQEYQVSKEDVIKLQSRKYHFIEVTGSKKAIFITFISVYGAKKSLNYNTAIDNQVTVDDLFNEGSFLRVS